MKAESQSLAKAHVSLENESYIKLRNDVVAVVSDLVKSGYMVYDIEYINEEGEF